MAAADTGSGRTPSAVLGPANGRRTEAAPVVEPVVEPLVEPVVQPIRLGEWEAGPGLVRQATVAVGNSGHAVAERVAPGAAGGSVARRPENSLAPIGPQRAGLRPTHQRPRIAPPSTGKIWPLIHDASSDSRKATALATSSGSPSRCARPTFSSLV
jgi:hypothetical protein